MCVKKEQKNKNRSRMGNHRKQSEDKGQERYTESTDDSNEDEEKSAVDDESGDDGADETEFEVTGVLAAHTWTVNGKKQSYYLVSWSGVDEDGHPYEDSWEPSACLSKSPDLLRKFQNDNPGWEKQHSAECQQLLAQNIFVIKKEKKPKK